MYVLVFVCVSVIKKPTETEIKRDEETDVKKSKKVRKIMVKSMNKKSLTLRCEYRDKKIIKHLYIICFVTDSLFLKLVPLISPHCTSNRINKVKIELNKAHTNLCYIQE